MNGKFNAQKKVYEMAQAVYDSIGNELKVGTVVYLKGPNLMAEVGHLIPPQMLPGEATGLPGEMVLILRWKLEPQEHIALPGFLAVQMPPATAVQVAESPKMQPVAVGANEEGG